MTNFNIIIISELTLYLLFKDPLYFIIGLPTGIMIYQVYIIGVFGYLFSSLQFEYGSRFFLPLRFRTLVYEHRRRIPEDFDLTKLDESMWPEWDYWLNKLHLPSLFTEDRSLSKIEGKKWYEIYMKTRSGNKLHYFWLLHINRLHYYQTGYYQQIDGYDD